MKNLLIITIFISMLASVVHASDYEEQYLSLTIRPLCTAEGQVELIFTNTSGGKLFIDPHFTESTLFDAVSQGMNLTEVSTDTRLQLVNRLKYETVDYWAVLTGGQIATHKIDFRNYVELDGSKTYRVGINAYIPVILESGQKVDVRLNSSLLNKPLTFQPDCIQ